MKLFFNGISLKWDVFTSKEVTYLTMYELSRDLEFKLTSTSKTKVLTITENVSKNNLLQDNVRTQEYIKNLNFKLKTYEIYTTEIKAYSDDQEINREMRVKIKLMH